MTHTHTHKEAKVNGAATTGALVELPEKVLSQVSCDRCGAALFRADTGWVCPRGLDHTPLIGDMGILDRINQYLPSDATGAKKDRSTGEQISGRSVQLRRVLKELIELSRRQLLPGKKTGRTKERKAAK
jgi:hypothetical protein